MRAVRAVVGRGEPIAGAGSPRLDDALNGARLEVGTVREDDDRRLDFVAQSR